MGPAPSLLENTVVKSYEIAAFALPGDKAGMDAQISAKVSRPRSTVLRIFIIPCLSGFTPLPVPTDRGTILKLIILFLYYAYAAGEHWLTNSITCGNRRGANRDRIRALWSDMPARAYRKAFAARIFRTIVASHCHVADYILQDTLSSLRVEQ